MAFGVLKMRRLAILSFCAAIVYAQSPNPDTDAFPILFNNKSSIGPDGPWWAISQAIDFPNQMISMLPGITQLSLAVSNKACDSASAACPLPIPTLWQESGAYEVSGGPKTQSKPVPSSQWDSWKSALLRLEGAGVFFSDRLTLFDDGDSASANFLDNHGMFLSNSYKATFPGGAEYTLDTGFLSLYAGQNTISWNAGTNGSRITFNRTIPDAYLDGYIPSMSYGVHVGSAVLDLPGSLVLSGYDSSRCLSEPIVSDSQSVILQSISLDVTSGGSVYIDAPSPSTNLLRAGGDSSTHLTVYPDPAVPYMYLPKDTCDAIAAHLPLTYNKDFNLYFWNTDDNVYHQMISSPHYMAFTFSTTGGSSTINIPFALMNLTLESPLVSSATPYFPCSPWDDTTEAPYHLGRSFLQGAFLAQNWQTQKLFLAQAPGPDLSLLSPYIKKIATSDTTISPATNPPKWIDTWSSTLKALPNNISEVQQGGSSGLSTGAIAGIVVGVVAGIALIVGLLAWLIIRKRRNNKEERLQQQEQAEMQLGPYQNMQVSAYRKSQPPVVYEVDSSSPPAEMDARQTLAELHGDASQK